MGQRADSEQQVGPRDVPVSVLVQFAHASAQVAADRAGADLLHIKGAAVDPQANPDRGTGTDADVLIRPAHVKRFMRALAAADWELWCDFDEGSKFEHAASLHHVHYGMLDVHQNFPGLHNAPAAAFDRLWDHRMTRSLAGIDCAALDPVGESLILLLHAARSPGRALDVANHWTDRTPEHRQAITALADEFGATVGLAIATGREGEVRDRAEFPLWSDLGSEGSRLEEWLIRWRAAPSARDRAHLLWRAPRVNRFVLEQRLGHRPSRAEIRREWWSRLGRGARSVVRRLPGRPSTQSPAAGAGDE